MAEHTVGETPREGRNWPRITGYVAAVVLSAALSGGGVELWIVGIVVAVVIRGLYVLAMRWSTRSPRFLTPWLFVAAAVVEVLSLAGQKG